MEIQGTTFDTYHNLPLLIHQTFTHLPELDLALRRLNSRLRTLDTTTQHLQYNRQRLQIRMLVVLLRQLQNLRQQEVEPGETGYGAG
jgi:hypothetical protein